MNKSKRIVSILLVMLMALTSVEFTAFSVNPDDCTHPSERSVYETVKDSTCQEEGQIKIICGLCKTVLDTKPTVKRDHVYEGAYRANGDGTHSRKCNTCDNYSESEVCGGGTAYCSAKALCKKCGGEYGEFDPESHKISSLTNVDGLAATCTEDGYSEYKHCSDCDTDIGKTVIDKKEHNFSGAAVSNKDGTHSYLCVNANCDEVGNTAKCSGGTATCTVGKICTVCREEYGEPDSENHTALRWVTEKAATCGNSGNNRYKSCADCNADVGKKVYPQLPHSFSDSTHVINNGDGTHSYRCINGCDDYGFEERLLENGGYEYCFGGTATCISKAICTVCNKEYGEIDSNNHVRTEYKQGKSASCTEAGYKTYRHCNDCGDDINKQPIEQRPHQFTGTVRSNDNGTHSQKCVNGCGQYGNERNCFDNNKDCVCDSCGYQLKHSYTNYIPVEGSATCLDDGTKTATCDVCGKASDTVIDEGSHLNAKHTYTNFHSNNDATCTQDGTKYAYCDVCGGFPITEADEDSAHGHSFTTYVFNYDAECVKNGTETARCNYCDETDTREAKNSMLGHSFKTYNYNYDAECLKDGTETAVCEFCGETDERSAVGTALGHIESDLLEYPDGFDCTVGGIAYVKCLRCEATMGEKIVKAVDEHMIVDDPAVPATCSATGKTAGSHCVICRKIIVAQEETSKVPHTFGAWENVKDHAATCTEKGKATRKCSVCGETEEKDTEPLGHDFSKDWTVDVKSTCTKAGVKSHHCKRCNAKTGETKAELAAHKYVNVPVTPATTEKTGKASQKCSVCGATTKAAKVAKIGKAKLSATSFVYDGNAKKPTVTVKDENGVKLKSGTDYKVKYASGRKAIGTYNVTVTFMGNYSGTVTLTFKIVPQTVTKIKASSKNGKISLSWTKPKGAQEYVIYYSTSKNGTYKKLGTKDTNSCGVSKLTVGKTYYFKIKAYKTVNKKNYYAANSAAVAVKVK